MEEQTSDPITRSLIACGVMAPVVALSALVVAASRSPDYDHVADTISKLSAQGVSDRWLWTIGLALYSGLMLLFAAGLRRRGGSGGRGGILWVAIAVHGVLMAGVTFLRDDLQAGWFFTIEGAAHDVLSGMAFSALVVAMLGTVAGGRADPALRRLRPVTILLGVTMTGIGIAFVFIPPGVQGVPQRAFVALAAIWIAVVAFRLLVRTE
jgi:hypothetical membrane protein